MSKDHSAAPNTGADLAALCCRPSCFLPYLPLSPQFTTEDWQAVLANLKFGECACVRLRDAASGWAPLLGEMYSKTRALRAARLAAIAARSEKKA
jgi:hypothetical protein